MLGELRELLAERRLLRQLPSDRRVFLRSGALAIEVSREEAERWLEEQIVAAERRLRDALEKIAAAFRALGEQDQARFRSLAAEIGLLTGVVPADRHDLAALEARVKEELELLEQSD